MDKDIRKLLGRHTALTHSESKKVVSHIQREVDGWVQNTIMIEGCEVPFRYKRRKHYRDLKNAWVNLTYYPATESIAGFDVDIMKVVRIKRS